MHTDQHGRNFSAIRVAASEQAEPSAVRLCNKLAELSGRLDEVHTFSKNQFVRWKPGLKNRKLPECGEPAIVREVLATPLFDPCEQASCAGSPDFGEPLTLVLAVLDPDGDFLEFRYDGRRFEPFEE